MQACWLIKNGVDVDKAFDLDPELALAMSITFAAFEGNDWDWRSMRFVEKNNGR